ncbi:hypothetical protein GF371_02205 [Candidatus Woesearchaeota archaeon]|nr:hypothetical protein [Candidatus Woesearchaeota archaeon]
MKKLAFAIVLLIVASLFITACGGKTELTPVAEEEAAETEETEEKTVELPSPPPAPGEEKPVEAEEPAEEKKVKDVPEDAGMESVTGESVVDINTGCHDPEVKELLDKAEKTKQLRYLMRKPPYFREESEVYVKDSKMKIILPEASKFTRGEYFNAVYLDTDTKEAIAYCEDRVRCDDLNKPFDVEYDDYYVFTPMDWAKMLGCGDKTGTETMFNRNTAVVEYKEDGKTNIMNLYDYYGVAAQVVKDVDAKDPKMWTFEVLSNSVTEEDVVHQTME